MKSQKWPFIRYITDDEFDVLARDERGKTITMLVATIVDSGAAAAARYLIREVLKQPQDLEVTDNDGNTALYWAIASDNVFMATQLMRQGADIRACSGDGQTMLSVAVSMANSYLVFSLQRRGLSMTAQNEDKDVDGRTPPSSHAAVGGGDKYIVSSSLLPPPDADPQIDDYQVLMPLDWAVLQGETRIAWLLQTFESLLSGAL